MFFDPSSFRFHCMIFSTGIWCHEKHLYPNFTYVIIWRAKVFRLAISWEIALLKIFAHQMKTCAKFGNKCFSWHQLQDENIHLIDSEGIQNKEHIFNCMKCHNFICSNVIFDLAVFVIQIKYSNMTNVKVY